jgi:hypothetical protein
MIYIKYKSKEMVGTLIRPLYLLRERRNVLQLCRHSSGCEWVCQSYLKKDKSGEILLENE